MARPRCTGGRKQPRPISDLHPRFARRVELRQAILCQAPERLGQRPDGMLPREREAGGRFAVAFDPTLVRGMGYYTGPIFEAAYGELGAYGEVSVKYDLLDGFFLRPFLAVGAGVASINPDPELRAAGSGSAGIDLYLARDFFLTGEVKRRFFMAGTQGEAHGLVVSREKQSHGLVAPTSAMATPTGQRQPLDSRPR